MLGADNATPAVASVCKPWEEQLGDGSNASKCSITPASIFLLPGNLLGMKPGMFGPELASVAVWGGLAWFLFMRGK